MDILTALACPAAPEDERKDTPLPDRPPDAPLSGSGRVALPALLLAILGELDLGDLFAAPALSALTAFRALRGSLASGFEAEAPGRASAPAAEVMATGAQAMPAATTTPSHLASAPETFIRYLRKRADSISKTLSVINTLLSETKS
jgi:hypothetical protein